MINSENLNESVICSVPRSEEINSVATGIVENPDFNQESAAVTCNETQIIADSNESAIVRIEKPNEISPEEDEDWKKIKLLLSEGLIIGEDASSINPPEVKNNCIYER